MVQQSSNPIDFTTLGSSDLRVSKICLGTMTWGQQNTAEEAFAQLNYAFNECGINFLDTAEMYPVPTKAETQGETDRIIGRWLRQSSSPDRSKIVLATKVAGPGITWLPGRNGASSRVSREQIMVSVDESLKRLGTDYIDLLQIHWPDRYVPLFGAAPYNASLEREAIAFEEQLITLTDLIKVNISFKVWIVEILKVPPSSYIYININIKIYFLLYIILNRLVKLGILDSAMRHHTVS